MSEEKKMLSFLKLKNIKHMMEWDDIKEGLQYHIPPLIYNKRMDFIVTEKKDNSMRIRKIGENYSQTLFRTDITTRFIVKKIELHGTKTRQQIL